MPDRPIVSAMANWGTSRKGATAIAFLAGRRLILAPAVPQSEKLDRVNASLRSPHGLIESAWRREDDKVTWDFTVPPNCEARLQPPATAVLERRNRAKATAVVVAAEGSLEAGRYRMTWLQKTEIPE